MCMPYRKAELNDEDKQKLEAVRQGYVYEWRANRPERMTGEETTSLHHDIPVQVDTDAPKDKMVMHPEVFGKLLEAGYVRNVHSFRVFLQNPLDTPAVREAVKQVLTNDGVKGPFPIVDTLLTEIAKAAGLTK